MIIINERFLEIGEKIQNNKANLTQILTTYLIQILLHENIHLLRRTFKKNYLFENEFTPFKEDDYEIGGEGGQNFLEFLFDTKMIVEININQSKEFLSINWKDIKEEKDLIKIRRIFPKLNEDRYFISREFEENEKLLYRKGKKDRKYCVESKVFNDAIRYYDSNFDEIDEDYVFCGTHYYN